MNQEIAMGRDTDMYLQHVEEYMQKATWALEKARRHADGTREQAMHLDDVRRALDDAHTVILRALPAAE